MRRARAYVWLASGIVWLVPALVLAQNAPGPKVRAQSVQAAGLGMNAATADQIRMEIQQKLAEVARAKAAEQPDQARIQQLTRELQTLRAQLRRGAGAGVSAQLGAGQCPLGGPGLGLGNGRGPGFATGGANQPAGAGFRNQAGAPGWSGGRGPYGQGFGAGGGAYGNCPYGQNAPLANMGAGGGRGGRGGGGSRGYRGGR